MNTPRDPGLFLGSFVALVLAAIVTAWIALPPLRHHGEEDEEAAPKGKKAPPEQVIGKADAVLTKVEELVLQLENDKAVKAKMQAPPKDGKKSDSEAVPPKTPGPAPLPNNAPGKTTASTH